jgi:hypothetical protein
MPEVLGAEPGGAAREGGLAELAGQVHRAIIRHNVLAYGRATSSVLHPPATAEAVQAFEADQGIRFPPSYRAFLLLHNGWQDYAYGFTLIGVSGGHTERALQDIEETIDIWKDAWTDAYGPATEESVTRYERRGDGRNPLEADGSPYLPNELPFGTNFNGGLLFFRRSAPPDDGELEVFAWETDCGVRARYPSFVAMLKSDMAQLLAEAAAYEPRGGAAHDE